MALNIILKTNSLKVFRQQLNKTNALYDQNGVSLKNAPKTGKLKANNKNKDRKNEQNFICV